MTQKNLIASLIIFTGWMKDMDLFIREVS